MKFRLALLLTLVVSVLLPSAAGAQDAARIHLIHGIPDTDVDVTVGGAAVIEDFSFGDTQDLSGFAGQPLDDLQVVLAGTDTVAIDIGDFDVPASGNFTVIAHLDADDPRVAEGLQTYYGGVDDEAWQVALISPERFARFAAFQMACLL